MPTTILHNETLAQAKTRRFAEEHEASLKSAARAAGTLHRLNIVDQQAKRLYSAEFIAETKDWVAEAKDLAFFWLDLNDKLYHSCVAANGELTVWTDIASSCHEYC